MKSIIIISAYFGRWPEWFSLYLESCRRNPTINWLFYTDCPIPKALPDNVKIIQLTFPEYRDKVSSQLDVLYTVDNPYKLCDLKPCYGKIHQNDIVNFDFYGFGDIDVIYGNLRNFLTPKVLRHQLISTHWDRISGHLCLFRNNEMMINAYQKIPNWQQLITDEQHHGIDESKYSKVFLRHKKYPAWARKLYSLTSPYQRNNYFQEQYSTILSPKPWHNGNWEHPEIWRWKDGRLTNDQDGEREFMYLHFMNWKSSTWLDKRRGDTAAWENLKQLNYVPAGKEHNGFTISRSGFYPLE
ncbi:DUF6625 family protein [Endozoicomonadaceae bacterium StTr2]